MATDESSRTIQGDAQALPPPIHRAILAWRPLNRYFDSRKTIPVKEIQK